jgi:hypothetical protein
MKVYSQVYVIYDFPIWLWRRKIWFNPPFLWKCLYQVSAIAVFPLFRLLTDFVCLLTYEYCLFLWKIARLHVFFYGNLFWYIFHVWCKETKRFHTVITVPNKGNNKNTELRAIFQRKRQYSYVSKQTKSVNNRKSGKTAMALTWYRHFQRNGG